VKNGVNLYSKEATKLINSAKASVGDRIRIVKDGKQYEGLLMPRIEVGDPNCIVIKLDSGYNFGIDASAIKRITLLEKAKAKGKKKRTSGKEPKPTENDIAILGCGGTIASRIEYKTGAVYPAITSEELIESFPQLAKKHIRSRTILSLFSEDLTPKHWQFIAKEVEKEQKEGAKGILLMHGTDTMHYTSAALSFMLKTPIPVVLVGAQRSSDRGSSDNRMNLLSAVAAAESDIAEVSVCMHGSMNDDFCYLHRGTKVRKFHTSRRDAFQSVNVRPLAKIFTDPDPGKNEKIEILTKDYNKRNEGKLEIDTRLNPNVALIHVFPGIPSKFIETIGSEFDGIVIAGTGLGHVPNEIIPTIKKLVNKGIPIVMTPQTIFGRVNMNVYSTGRELLRAGVIGNYCDYLPEVAMVKLMVALGRYRKIDDIRGFMSKNVAGEISERSEILNEKFE